MLSRIMIFLIILGLPVHSLRGQGDRVDSLKKLLLVKKRNQDRANIFCELSEAYSSNLDSALHYALLAHSKSRRIHDPNLIIKVAFQLINTYSYLDHSDEILRIGVPLLPMVGTIEDTLLRVKFLNLVGAFGYHPKAMFTEEVGLLEEALALLQTSPKSILNAAIIAGNISNVYKTMGFSDKASNTIENTLIVARKFDDSLAIARLLLNQGGLLFDNEQQEAGLQKFLDSYQIIRNSKQLELIHEVHERLGQGYMEIGNSDSAIYYLSLYRREPNLGPSDKAFSEFVLGKVLARAKRYREAYPLLQESKSYFEKTGNKLRVLDITAALGHATVGIGQRQAGLDMIWSVIDSAHAFNSHTTLQKVFKSLELSYSSLGDWKQVAAIKDSLMNLKNIEIANQLESLRKEYNAREDYLLQKQEKQRLLLENTSLQVRNRFTWVLLFLIILLCLALLVIGLIYRKNWRIKQTLATELDQQVQKKTSELTTSLQHLSAAKEDLQQFAFLASHNFKTSIRTVKSMSDLLLRKLSLEEEKPLTWIKHIQFAGMEMDATLMGLKQLFSLRDAPLHFEMVNLTEVVDIAMSTAIESFPHKKLDISISDLPDIVANKNEMIILFNHLINNAFRYHPTEELLKLQIEASSDETGYSFKISDNGIGIQAEYLSQIFLPFTRLHHSEVYQGVGLGLTIVNRIVTRHGGEIEVESEPGLGSIFTFCLRKNWDMRRQPMG